MELPLSLILDKIRQYSPNVFQKSTGTQRYGHWQLLTEDDIVSESVAGTLYLWSGSKLPDSVRALSADDALLCTSAAAQTIKNDTIICTVVAVGEPSCFPNLCNALLTLYARMFRWEAEIDKVIDKNLGLQAFLDVSEDLFQNPVCFITNSLQVIACTKHIPIPNPDIRYARDNHVFPTKMIKALVEKNYLSESESHDELTYTYKELYVGCPLLVKAFPANRMHVKTLGLYNMNVPPSDAEFDAMQLLCEKAYKYLVSDLSNDEAANNTDRNKILLRSAIEGKFEEKELPAYASLLGISADSEFFIYTVCFKSYHSSHANFLLRTLTDAMRGRHVFRYKEQIIILEEFSTKQREDLHSALLDYLNSLMADNDTFCGYARFQGFIHMKEGYSMASSAAELGKTYAPEKNVHSFENYIFEFMVSSASEKVPLGSLYMRELDMLMAYDKKHGTNYMCLLKQYLIDSGMQISKVVQMTNAHRNTVRYRLDRIAEIMNLDLDDPETAFRLCLSMKTYECGRICDARLKAGRDRLLFGLNC